MPPPDPHEPEQRTPRYAKDQSQEALLARLNALLAGWQWPGPEDEARGAELPIVYIVGVPRSGTTLVSQLVARGLEVGYVDQVVARFWLRPAVGVALSRSILGSRAAESIRLESDYGSGLGPAGPHEFGYFWRHWLPYDSALNHHLDAQALSRVDRAGLRRVLRAELLAAFGRPVAFKNVACGFQARFLTEIHPSSLFVHVTRRTEDTTRSILRARVERHGRLDAWWSLKPSSYPFPDLGRDPVRDVVRQVLDSREEFQAEMAAAGVQSLELAYEDVCARPDSALDEIAARIVGLGCPVTARSLGSVALRPSAGPRLSQEIEVRLKAELANLA
jgi:LPS sulfotransferase NodH